MCLRNSLLYILVYSTIYLQSSVIVNVFFTELISTFTCCCCVGLFVVVVVVFCFFLVFLFTKAFNNNILCPLNDELGWYVLDLHLGTASNSERVLQDSVSIFKATTSSSLSLTTNKIY